MIARHGTAWHVETLVREYRAVRREEERARAEHQHEERRLSYYWDDDGSLVVSGRLPPEQGAFLIKALETAREALYQDSPLMGGNGKNVPAGTSCNQTDDDLPKPENESIGSRRADALLAMAESYLANGPAALAGGDRCQITVHVDAAVLDDPGSEGHAEIEDGPWIASDTVRRLACEASLVQMVDDRTGLPLDVGRRTRSIPPAIRRALKARDGGCRFPGCTQIHWVDGHHIRHWADGGETKLDNLVLLCRFHHRLVHEGGFALYRDAHGDICFKSPDGRAMPAAGPPKGNGSLKHLLTMQRRLGISTQTCVTQWHGVRVDHAMAIEGLSEADGVL